MKADAKTETAIRVLLEEYAEAYAKRDLKGLEALFAPDPDVVIYGTGVDEKLVGLSQIAAQAERDWSQSEAVAISYDWTSISAADPVAWVAADVTVKAKVGGEDITLPARLTAVLENRDGKWLIVQSHLSLPAATQSEGESFPT